MNKQKSKSPEPELSPAASRVSLDTLSLAGAGLPEALERLAERSGIELDRFTGTTMVCTDDLDTMLGDRAQEIREVLDDPGFLTEAEAAATMGTAPEVCLGLAIRRGCITTAGAGGEVLVHKILWENLKLILVAESRFPTDSSDWVGAWDGPMNKAIWAVTSRKPWVDPYDPDHDLKAAAALQSRRHARDPWEEPALDPADIEDRPGRKRRDPWDPDEELAARCSWLGIRHTKNKPSTDFFTRGRLVVAGFDCHRLAGFTPHVPYNSYGATAHYRAMMAYTRMATESYESVFPAAVDHASLRAELEAKLRRPALAAV
jgi:hypothetical protein